MQTKQDKLSKLNTTISQLEMDLKKEEELKTRLEQLMKTRQDHTSEIIKNINSNINK